MSFLKASGVTTGDDLGNFNPDSPITRQEFAVLALPLARARTGHLLR
ncbi:MAG: S-layer homology domain-containing protein [Oscillospiraceae bacterium]